MKSVYRLTITYMYIHAGGMKHSTETIYLEMGVKPLPKAPAGGECVTRNPWWESKPVCRRCKEGLKFPQAKGWELKNDPFFSGSLGVPSQSILMGFLFHNVIMATTKV